MNRIISLLLLTFTSLSLYAQRTCVVADKFTHAPISYASIYGRDAGVFRSAITSERGLAHVKFSISSYTISHLNYEKCIIRDLPDTIFLTPRYYQAGEVIVKSEPDWIRPLLRRFLKAKKRLYASHSSYFNYQYTTQSIEGKSFYQYRANGILRQPLSHNGLYAISPDTGLIVSVDSTRLTDVTNLRRMLYEDFVSEFDRSFINDHKFSIGNDIADSNPHEVELLFRSKKNKADRGRFIIDTLRCVIRSATRETGTDWNKSNRVSPIMLTFAHMLTGYNIDQWIVSYGVSYATNEGVYYPTAILYKFFFQATEKTTDEQSTEFDRESGGGFSNMEAEIIISPIQLPSTKLLTWKPLPRPWYIKVNTDEERQQEVELAHLNAVFQAYNPQ